MFAEIKYKSMFTVDDKNNFTNALNQFIGILNSLKSSVANYEPPAPPPPEKKPEYLTRKATADYLNISLSTLWRITKQGQLNSYSVSKKIMYRTTEIDNFITSNQKKWKA